MKSIKERAREFVDAPCTRRCKKCNVLPASCRFYNDEMSFIAGAESEHAELTRWHDPKEELPEQGKRVLLKLSSKIDQSIRIEIGWWTTSDVFMSETGSIYSEILGWREIHE